MTETLSSCLSRGIWREDRSGHAARIASEITSLGYMTGPKLMQGCLPLLLGCPTWKGFWGEGAAGAKALSQEESMTRGRGQ